MPRRTLAGKRALITGASSGIGRALALELARNGVLLLVTARREERLAALVQEIQQQGGSALALAGDIASAPHREHLLAVVRDTWGSLDFLVNNAGVGALGPFATAAPTRLREIMEVNFFAPVELIRGALPLLRGPERPLIVNVSSVLGHRGVPYKSEYCASKFALHGFSDALRAELARKEIDVLLVSPSTTASEFFENVLEKQVLPAWAKQRGASPESVARHTIRAMRQGRHEIILTAGGKLLVWLDRLCPPLANWLVARYG